MVTSFGSNDRGVAGEVESHPGAGEPRETMGMWPHAAAKAAPPNGHFVAVHLLSLSESESGVKVHCQTLTLDFVLHI